MPVETFGNVALAVVSSGGTGAPSSGTTETWTVQGLGNFPVVSSPVTQLHVADISQNTEIIAVTNMSGAGHLTWTVTRGAESTTPVAHAAGFVVYQVTTAGFLNSVAGAGSAFDNATDWLNVVNAYGADPTGVADSTTAIQNAVNAVPAAGGVVYFPAGTYKVTSTVTISRAAVTLQGDGMWSTVISYTGSGDCIRMYSTQLYTSGFGGGVKGITVDGTSASAGACGVHAGDIYLLQWDVGVRKFQGSGSKGIWFDNQYYYAEDMYGHVWAQQNTLNVVFDNSANVGGGATNSFARPLLDIVLDCKGVGDGVTLLNGADVYDPGRLTITGNIDYGAAQHYVLNITGQPGYSFTATNASPCVFTAAGSYYSNGTFVTLSGGSLPAGFSAQGYFVVNASGATFQLSATSGGSAINSTSTGSGTVQGPYSQIANIPLNIGVECNSTSGAFQPITINFGSQGNNKIARCTGVIDFTANNAFANAVNWTGSFQFDGICLGDSDLLRVTGAGQAAYNNGAIGNNFFIVTRFNALATVAPASNVAGAILGTNDPGTGGAHGGNWANATFTLVNNGAGSVTFAASGTSHVATGTACVIPAGTSMTFAWIANSSLWYPVTAGSGGAGVVNDGGSPSGCIAQTMPWWFVSSSGITATSGTLYLHAVTLPAGIQVSNITFAIGSTGGATLTHGWYVLLNSALLQVAHTADQTSGGLTGGTAVTKALVTPYTPPAAGPYYIGYMVAASTQPTFCGAASTQGGSMFAEFPSNGASSTGQTTPGTDGTTSYAAISAAGSPVYGYVS